MTWFTSYRNEDLFGIDLILREVEVQERKEAALREAIRERRTWRPSEDPSLLHEGMMILYGEED